MRASELKNFDKTIPVEKFGLYNAEAETDILSHYDTENGKRVTLPIDPSKFCSVQPDVYKDILLSYYKHGWSTEDGPIEVIRHNKRYYLIDGTHRFCAAILKKDPTIRVTLYTQS